MRIVENGQVDLTRSSFRREQLGPETEPPPTTTPERPDVETEPNVQPRTDPVTEPEHPCEHPGTSCPIRKH